ncbi:helix-turn-helix transcriptional regulator [bacterium]|nr:helix-turn-helix transcriptional regulator [bacterium]
MISFNLAEFLIVSGSAHGIIFSLILLFKSKKDYLKQNLALVLFIVVFSIVVLNGWYIGSEFYLKHPQFLSLPIYFTLAIGPLFYVYISFLLHKEYVFRGWQLMHIVPAIIQFCYHLFVFILPVQDRILYFQSTYLNIFLPIEEVLGMISLGGYFFVSYRTLRKYQKSVYHNFTNLRRVLYRWLNYFILAIGIFLVAWSCLAIIDFSVSDYTKPYSFYYPIYFGIVVILYWLIIEGFFNPLKIQPDYVLNSPNGSLAISPNETNELLKKLNEAMTKKQMYLRPKLSLQELAEYIDINPKYLSALINNETNKNFYDFVNEFRIEMAKKELISAENTHLTISAISTICGFNSKSTFNEVFKKYTGQTPSAFIKSNFTQQNMIS